MSLRAVHIIVILLSIGLSFFFGSWALGDFQKTQNHGSLVWGCASLALGSVLIPYIIWFFIKTKKVKN